jgi:hypothetical protein
MSRRIEKLNDRRKINPTGVDGRGRGCFLNGEVLCTNEFEETAL